MIDFKVNDIVILDLNKILSKFDKIPKWYITDYLKIIQIKTALDMDGFNIVKLNKNLENNNKEDDNEVSSLFLKNVNKQYRKEKLKNISTNTTDERL